MRILTCICLGAGLVLAACADTPDSVAFEPVADTTGAISLTQSTETAVAATPTE